MRCCLRLVVLLLIALAMQAAVAGRLYKHVDKHGITHYSDRPPADPSIKTETLHYRAEAHDIVRLRLEEGENGYQASAFNPLHGPVQVQLRFTGRVNVVASPPLPLRAVLPAQGKQELAHFKRNFDPLEGRFEVAIDAVPGAPIQHADNTLYALPVAADSGWRIGQGFNGAFSHNDAQNRYAIDIGVDEGEPVLAARDGVVMQVEDDFEGAGLDLEKYATRANFVRILHADGSMAVYAHLQTDSMQVRAGQQVRQGQMIARAGNTGFSTGPHLHFALQINRGMELHSVSFRMRGPDGELALTDRRDPRNKRGTTQSPTAAQAQP